MQEAIILAFALAGALLLFVHGGLFLATTLMSFTGAAADGVIIELVAIIMVFVVDVLLIGIIFPRLLPQLWKHLKQILRRED